MAYSHSLTEKKDANSVIQESRKSNQQIIKKALSKFVRLNNTTNTRPTPTGTNTRKTKQVRSKTPKRERHWLGVLLELV